MDSKLKKLYVTILLPSILGFIFSYWIKAYNLMEAGWVDYSDILAPSIFILTVTFAIALPIFYRTLFAHRKRHISLFTFIHETRTPMHTQTASLVSHRKGYTNQTAGAAAIHAVLARFAHMHRHNFVFRHHLIPVGLCLGLGLVLSAIHPVRKQFGFHWL